MFIGDVRRLFLGVLKETKVKIKVYKGLCLALLIYVLVLSTVAILKHHAFLTSFYDLGIFNQAFWTTLFEHKLFYETGDLAFNPVGSFFGTHFSPILFLILPFYAIYPSCETLIVLQTIILAIGAIPVYLMARKKLGDKLALYVAVLYLVYPPLIALNLNDFHLEAFTSTLLLFATFYLENEKWMKFSMFTILAMSTLEFVPLIVISMVLYGIILYIKGWFKERERALKFFSLIAIIAVLWFLLALKIKAVFNPYTTGIPSPWRRVLQDPMDIPKFLVENSDKKMFYIIALLAPLAFIPLLAPTPLIMTLPWFFVSFLSDNSLHYWIFAQYNSFVIPFIFTALIKAIEKLSNNRRNTVKNIFCLMFITTVLVGSYLPFAPSRPWNYQLPVQTERGLLLNEILALIPPNASILTQNDIGPHVSNRLNAYVYVPEPLKDNVPIEYILIDVNSGWFKWVPGFPESKLISPVEFAKEALNSGKYGIFASSEGILLLKRGYDGKPIIFKPYIAELNYKNLKIGDVGEIVNYETSVSGKVIYHSSEKESGYIWYGPYINLPPGLYEATFTLKVNSAFEPEDRLLTLDVTSLADKAILSKKSVYGVHVDTPEKWINVTLLFGVNGFSEQVEFRGFAEGNYTILLDRIIVKQISPLPSTVKEMNFGVDKLSITNIAIRYGNIISHSNGSGVLWYGPYLDLPKGKYTVVYWLKLGNSYNGNLIKLDITANSGRTILAEVILNSLNFTSIGSWQQFRLALFTNEDLKRVEFRGIYVREDAPISLLLIEVIPNVHNV